MISAIEAWIRLQQLGGAASLVSDLAGEALLAIALPLLAIVVAVALHRGARTGGLGRGDDGAKRPRPGLG